jgi:hypothetical protein
MDIHGGQCRLRKKNRLEFVTFEEQLVLRRAQNALLRHSVHLSPHIRVHVLRPRAYVMSFPAGELLRSAHPAAPGAHIWLCHHWIDLMHPGIVGRNATRASIKMSISSPAITKKGFIVLQRPLTQKHGFTVLGDLRKLDRTESDKRILENSIELEMKKKRSKKSMTALGSCGWCYGRITSSPRPLTLFITNETANACVLNPQMSLFVKSHGGGASSCSCGQVHNRTAHGTVPPPQPPPPPPPALHQRHDRKQGTTSVSQRPPVFPRTLQLLDLISARLPEASPVVRMPFGEGSGDAQQQHAAGNLKC